MEQQHPAETVLLLPELVDPIKNRKAALNPFMIEFEESWRDGFNQTAVQCNLQFRKLPMSQVVIASDKLLSVRQALDLTNLLLLVCKIRY